MTPPNAPIHLDTNALIALNNPAHPLCAPLMQKMAEGHPLRVSAIVWAEFKCGGRSGLPPHEEANARLYLSAILPITQAEAELASRLFNATNRRSRTLPDCLIAACAILSAAPLATENREDFAPFVPHGLSLA